MPPHRDILILANPRKFVNSEGERETEASRKIGIVAPRHSDRDDYVVRTEPAQNPEGIEAGPPESSEAGFGGEQGKEDPYREKAE